MVRYSGIPVSLHPVPPAATTRTAGGMGNTTALERE
jgi:hypothetical protein